MIPRAYITAWRQTAPWQNDAQVEQDLVIERAIVEVFSDEFLRESLAFRGGTALYKLYKISQPRYSEDIDLVKKEEGPVGKMIDHLRERLKFLGKARVNRSEMSTTLIFNFESEILPVVKLKLKVETNCNEAFTVQGYKEAVFKVKSAWFNGKADIVTFSLEELLGTKLRALYQRRKGRDLFDLYHVLTSMDVNDKAIVNIFNQYLSFQNLKVSRKQFVENLSLKMKDLEFLGDTEGLLRPDVKYFPEAAFDLVIARLISLV